MRPFGDAARRDVALLRQHRGDRAVGVVALHLRDVVGAVHVAEVRGVDAVLGHLLRHRVDEVARPVAVAPRRVAHLGDLGDLPLRLDLVRVPPRHDHAVAHDDGVRAQPRLAVHLVRVRDLHAAALAVEGPAVERALERRRRSPCRRRRGARRGAGSTRPGGGTHRPRRARARGRCSSSAARWPCRARGPRGRRPGTSRRGVGTGSDGSRR